MAASRAAAAVAGLVLVAAALAGREAHAFCRTMTCPLPPDFSPAPEACLPADFDSYCASLSTPAKALPVWWRNACVGYDVQRDASRQVPYATASQMAAAAFAKWTSLSCPMPGDDAGGAASGKVSIDVRDLGPVACAQVQYNSNAGNQHVIVFHDDVWPHDDANNTLGLTTITFDPDTGEIYDADMEINGTVTLSVGDPVPPDGYDFESVITHESGHFLGLAHSGDDRATMFASYAAGTTFKRVLTSDDVAGLCSIYLPDGTRAVDSSLGGAVSETACDPTPRHGFATTCAGPPQKACAASVAGEGGDGVGWGAGVALASAAGLARRLRRRAPREADLGG